MRNQRKLIRVSLNTILEMHGLSELIQIRWRGHQRIGLKSLSNNMKSLQDFGTKISPRSGRIKLTTTT